MVTQEVLHSNIIANKVMLYASPYTQLYQMVHIVLGEHHAKLPVLLRQGNILRGEVLEVYVHSHYF